MIRPLGDKVLLKREKAKEMIGSLYIPETVKEKPQICTVVAVGSGKYIDGSLIPIDLKENDKVLVGKYIGTEVEFNSEAYLIVGESDILLVMD